MASWKRLQPQNPDRETGIRGYRETMYFGTEDLDYDTAAGQPADTTISTIAAVEDDVPINRGDAHPDPAMRGAPCVSKRLVAGPQNGRAIVAVIFDASGRFGSAPRLGSQTDTIDTPLLVPKATKLTSGVNGGLSSYQIQWLVRGTRAKIIYTETKYVDGPLSAFLEQTAKNVGKLYKPTRVPVPMIFRSPTAREVATGLQLVRYTFWSYAPVRAIPAGTINGFDLAVPALDWLDEWDVDPRIDQPRTINRVQASSLYDAGDTLP